MRKPRASGKPEVAASPPSAVRKQCDIHAWAGGLDPRGHGWRCFSRLLTMYRTAVAKIVAFVLGTPTFFFWLSLAPSSMSPHHEDENKLAWAQERNRASPWCPIKGYGGGQGTSRTGDDEAGSVAPPRPHRPRGELGCALVCSSSCLFSLLAPGWGS